MKPTIIHVNQHVIRKNHKTGARMPALTVKSGRRNTYAHEVLIIGSSEVVYRPDKPLSCGARVWIQTNGLVITLQTIERFWSKVVKGDDCWLWQAYKNPKGYGQFGIGAKLKMQAHRFAYLITYGAFGDNLVLHRCDNSSCVRPDHLYAGTAKQNTRDMLQRGRYRPAETCLRGEAAPGAKLTLVKVRRIRHLVEQGHSHRSVAKQFDVRHSTVSRIVRGDTWKAA